MDYICQNEQFPFSSGKNHRFFFAAGGKGRGGNVPFKKLYHSKIQRTTPISSPDLTTFWIQRPDLYGPKVFLVNFT